MEEAKIRPDVIDKIPSEVVQVRYPSGKVVDLGNELTPTQVKDTPSVSWTADPDAYYTLCMTDPDPPDPKIREVLHWMVANIPGSEISRGEAVTPEYVGSGPPQGSGLHRYIFLVYRQAGKISWDEEKEKFRSRPGRLGFSIRKFAAKHNLGDPVAGNFYRAQWDEYVPILQAKLAQQK